MQKRNSGNTVHSVGHVVGAADYVDSCNDNNTFYLFCWRTFCHRTLSNNLLMIILVQW